MNELFDKTFYIINFCGNVGSEINKIHLGIVFTMPGLKNMIFCIPATSPKEKHFRTSDGFKNRNGKDLKHFSWYYLKQTDSILMFDQIKTISNLRLISLYKKDNIIQEINDVDYERIKKKFKKYLSKILK